MTVLDQYAQWIPSPFFTEGRNGYAPQYVILHGTAGGSSAQNIAAWFQNPQAQVSAHYVIGQDGAVVQTVDENNWAWANGVLSAGHADWWNESVNPNWLTISIEHVKPSSTNSDALTTAQQSASFALIKRICQRWNIPMRLADAEGGITGHFSIDPVNRSQCPGNYPWAALWAYLKPPAAPQIKTGDDLTMLQLTDPMGKLFSDSSNACWVCNANKIRWGGDHLVFFRKHEGIFGLPLTSEIRLAQYPSATFIIYERVIAVYDPQHKIDNPPGSGDVYLLHIDGGLGQQMVAKSLVSALNAQIKQLTDNSDNLTKQIAALRTELAQQIPAPPPPELAQLQLQLAAQQKTIETYKQAVQTVISNLQHLAV